jgi:hypothetical protein
MNAKANAIPMANHKLPVRRSVNATRSPTMARLKGSEKRSGGPEAKAARQRKQRVSAKGKTLGHAGQHEDRGPDDREPGYLFRHQANGAEMEIARQPQNHEHSAHQRDAPEQPF